MEIYICSDCGEQYDNDNVVCHELDDELICDYCFADDKYDSEERAMQKAQDQYNDCTLNKEE
jgi:hypothetical protein